MLPLRFPRVWLAIGIAFVVSVIATSLAPGEYVEDMMIWNDKVTHAMAYTGLVLWFAGLYPRKRYFLIALALFLLGAAIEFLQGSMSYGRFGDFADLIANTTGVAMGLLLARAGLGQWAHWVEGRLGPLLRD